MPAPNRDATGTVAWLIALTGLIRLALAAPLGLSVDESYTVAISRQLALSYFDHPPLHVWLAGAWARVLGAETPLLMRAPDMMLFAGTTWLMYRLTASLYGERAGLWAALALNLAPLFTLNTAAGVLPDGPLALFALLAVWCFTRAALAPPSCAHARWWMLGAGAAAGLALLSKYTAIFVLLGLALYVLSCRPRWLLTPTPWLALPPALLLFSPVLLWNHAHAWASFAFQGARALPAAFSVARAAAFLGAQLLYLFPWVAAGLVLALVPGLRRGRRDERGWLFVCLALPPIVVFALVALWSRALPHWTAIGWLFAFPPLGALLARIELSRPRALRRATAASAAALLAVVTLLASQAATGWLGRWVPALAAADPTLDFLDWRDLAPAVAGLRPQRPGLLVATVSWIDAGKADYALGGAVPVLCLSQDPRHFAFLHDTRAFAGRDALLVADPGRADWLALAAPHFRRIEPAGDLLLRRAGRAAVTLHTALGYDLQVPAAEAAAHADP